MSKKILLLLMFLSTSITTTYGQEKVTINNLPRLSWYEADTQRVYVGEGQYFYVKMTIGVNYVQSIATIDGYISLNNQLTNIFSLGNFEFNYMEAEIPYFKTDARVHFIDYDMIYAYHEDTLYLWMGQSYDNDLSVVEYNLKKGNIPDAEEFPHIIFKRK